MFIPVLLQHLIDDDPLFRGHRFVHVDGGDSGGGPGEDSGRDAAVADDDRRKKPPPEQEEEKEEKEESAGNNQRFVTRLEQLKSRDAITEKIFKMAVEGLGVGGHREKVARMLANESIKSGVFTLVDEALDRGSKGAKLIAEQFAKGKLTSQNLQGALGDIDSKDQYREPLARRLGMGRINQDEYQKAREHINDDDPDKKWAAQMLALGRIKPDEFRQRMEMAQRAQQEQRAEQQDDEVAAEQERVHDRIVDLLLQANVVIEELPERERTRPLLRLRESLRKLNNDDRNNRSALITTIKQVNTEKEHLNEKEVQYIYDFDAKTKDEFKTFKNRLAGMDLTTKQQKQIIRLKENEWEIERKFLTDENLFESIMKSAGSILNRELKKKRLFKEAEKASGIELKEGATLQYGHVGATGATTKTVKIHNIETIETPILNPKTGDAIGSQPNSLRITLDNGETYSLGRFLKWVDSADVHEVIRSQAELEQALDMHAMGMHFKSGQHVDFTKGYKRDRKGNMIPKRDSVQIKSIGNSGVTFSEPVVTLTPDQAPNAGLTSARQTREMNLGEFAKWTRRNEAMPEIRNLEELRTALSSWQNHKNQTGDQKPESYPPIRVEPGEVLQFADDQRAQFQIKDASDKEITFADGTKMNLPQFLWWAKEKNVERGDADSSAKRAGDAAENLGDEPREVAEKKERAKAKKSIEDKMEGAITGKDGKKINLKNAFNKISPYVAMEVVPHGPIKEVFAQTTFLSIMDIYNMGKEIIELIKRKHQRRSKMRYGKVGANLPGVLGTEMKRIQQQGENEEVNQYKEAMDMWGVWDVLNKLHTTGSKDEGKACFLTLVEKGELRWDDMRMWSALNRLTSAFTSKGAALYVKPVKGLQRHPVTGREMNGEDMVKDGIDELWGEGTWADWFSQNINAYNSKKSAYEYKGKQLEHDPKGTGGLTAEMTRLLKDWKAGKYVNPHEYEELIDFGIKYGKMSAEDKFFFIIEGVSAKSPSGPMRGMTLLHLDRIGDLDGQYLNQFPMLDFFTNKLEKPLHPKYVKGEVDKPPKGGYTVEDYEYFRDEYFGKDSSNCVAGTQFSKFLWEYMMTDPYYRLRLSKGLRRAEDMDHDDAHMFIPPAGLEEMQNLTGSYQGQQKFFTPEGYKNAYPGFNQYIVSLSNQREEFESSKAKGYRITEKAFEDNAEQMLSAIQGYFRYDSFLDGRDEKTSRSRARLDREHYNQVSVNDLAAGEDFTVGDHQRQMNNMVKAICDEYGIDWREKMLFEEPKYNEKAKQNKISSNIHEFLYNELPDAFKRDNGRAVFEIVHNRKMKALKDDKDEHALRGLKTSNRLLTGNKSEALPDTSIKSQTD